MPGVVGLGCAPALRRQKQEDYHEFEDNMGYIANSRPIWPCSKKKPTNKHINVKAAVREFIDEYLMA